MEWSGSTTIAWMFYCCLLTGSCSWLPSAVQTSALPQSGSVHPHMPDTYTRSQTALHSAPSHSPSHTPFPAARSQDLPPRVPSFRHRTTQSTHHHLVATRIKRQSSAASLLLPAALEGAVPPSQHPWVILWGPTVADEDGVALSSDSSTSRPGSYREGDPQLHEEPARGLDLRGAPTTLRPPMFPPTDEGTDPQLYVTIVISVLIVLVATGIIIKFCCERRDRRRRHRTERCPLPEEGSLQPLTDLSPDTDIPAFQSLKLGDLKSVSDKKGGLYRTSKIPVVTM
ncbi:PILR alpha-associated neural protein [Spea bombifrons]|uniref:PILR alpha-associated neural protein n=1 Tax=Spea bombifrons TaxID=233779 RepID=UPI00234BEEED|nr:PILR alpha-associated neural protein [Spea bombifrons]XP_053306895.1 PILR alpha-associated neural protein [Spea bombifrons]